MKEWKNKEVVAGLIVIIILGLIALFLLIRREIKQYPVQEESTITKVEEVTEEEVVETIPQEDVSQAEMQENVEETKPDSVQDTASSIQVISNPDSAAVTEDKERKKELYAIFGEEKYKAAVLTERKKDDGQLKELYEYWENYKLNAVGDLIRLERFQEISEELKDTGNFYYYGTVDRLGRPSGKGLAVYEDNTYYYGDWREGMRHGKGMWLEVAIYTKEKQVENIGVVEHSYNGEWSKDLPNGEGQEHFSYDYEILEEESLENQKAIANVIGYFRDGYYHGEMYVMTTDAENNTFDWRGNCQNGVWDIIAEGNTTNAVWEDYERDENEEAVYHYMYPEENANWGIIGLKK